MLRRIAIAAISALALSGVNKQPARLLDTSAEDALWLPSDARLLAHAAAPAAIKDGRSIYGDGTASVVFEIESDQEELSNRIVDRMAATGWRQRRAQHLNPQLPTSFDRGWIIAGGGVLAICHGARRQA